MILAVSPLFQRCPEAIIAKPAISDYQYSFLIISLHIFYHIGSLFHFAFKGYGLSFAFHIDGFCQDILLHDIKSEIKR